MKLLATLMLLGSVFVCNFAHAQATGSVIALPMEGKCVKQIKIADQLVKCSDNPILLGKVFPDGNTVFKLHYTGEKSPAMGFVTRSDEATADGVTFNVGAIGFGTEEKHAIVKATTGKCIMGLVKSETPIASITCAAKDEKGKTYSFDFQVTLPAAEKESAPGAKQPTTVKPFIRDTRKFSVSI
jgi:hypothetical protein